MQAENHRFDQPFKACFFILGYALLMSGLGCCIKIISKGLPFEMIVFFRNLFALILLLGMGFRRSQPLALSTRVFGFHFMRSVFGLGAMYCYFYTLGKIPLAEATLLSYTSPLFMPFFALVWLGESVSLKNWMAILIGFVGIFLILKPDSDILNMTSFAGIGAGMCVALAAVTIRRMSGTESPGTMVFYFTLISTFVSALPLFWAWQCPTLSQFQLLMVMGAVAVVGQFFMAKGYSIAPAAQVGPFTYATVVFSSIWGWVFWKEGLDIYFFSGAALICFSGIFASRSHRVKAITPSPDGPAHHA